VKEVYLVGVGQTPVMRAQSERVHDLAVSAVDAALAHAQVDPADVGALYIGNMTAGILSSQTQLAALVAEHAALAHGEALSVEAACASGSAAMRMGYLAVASGAHDAVVVCGAERLTHADKQTVTRALATAADYELESSRQETFISLNARLMREYIAKYKVPAERLAGFSITAHENALSNPHALFHKAISLDDYVGSRVVSDPLRLFDVSPICDGAAAVVLASREVLNGARNGSRVRVAASCVATSPMALARRDEPLELSAVAHATKAALAQAGITRSQLSLLELHDAYTIMTALSLESAGFAAPGTAWQLARDERISRSGDLPISTFGGLKARGHPVGATGVYQLVEAYLQLTGAAGANQIENAEFALTQNIGGTASTVVNHILQRVA
jgi:acetyl-CoA C-acetyltransferase